MLWWDPVISYQLSSIEIRPRKVLLLRDVTGNRYWMYDICDVEVDTIGVLSGSCALPIDASSVSTGTLSYGSPTHIAQYYSSPLGIIKKAYINSDSDTILENAVRVVHEIISHCG